MLDDLAARGRGRQVLAVDGPSGAGKTRLAGEAASRLRAGGVDVAVVHLDDLYTGWDGLEGGVDRLVDGVLRPFAAGEDEIRVQRWDWKTRSDGPLHRLAAPRLLVVEGVGAGARRCAPFLSVLIWLDAPIDVRRRRAMARDGDAYAPYWRRWAAAEQAHFRREGTRQRADVRWSTHPAYPPTRREDVP